MRKPRLLSSNVQHTISETAEIDASNYSAGTGRNNKSTYGLLLKLGSPMGRTEAQASTRNRPWGMMYFAPTQLQTIKAE
jgi:hypothetical protein